MRLRSLREPSGRFRRCTATATKVKNARPAVAGAQPNRKPSAPRQLQHGGQDGCGCAGQRAAHRVTQIAADSQQHTRFPSAQHQIGHDTVISVCSKTSASSRFITRSGGCVCVPCPPSPAARLGAPPSFTFRNPIPLLYAAKRAATSPPGSADPGGKCGRLDGRLHHRLKS